MGSMHLNIRYVDVCFVLFLFFRGGGGGAGAVAGAVEAVVFLVVMTYEKEAQEEEAMWGADWCRPPPNKKGSPNGGSRPPKQIWMLALFFTRRGIRIGSGKGLEGFKESIHKFFYLISELTGFRP